MSRQRRQRRKQQTQIRFVDSQGRVKEQVTVPGMTVNELFRRLESVRRPPKSPAKAA